MGRRGPQPTPNAILKLRGSHAVALRERRSQEKDEDAGLNALERIEKKYGLSRTRKPSGKPIPAKWLALFGEIPGYDPVATAEDCWFDPEDAGRAVAFVEDCLTHVEGSMAGKPLVLEDWQKAIVGCAFGWKRPDGFRRYREVFQYVPRKNGKSTLVAALVMLVAFCDSEAGAQIYSSAAEREQAALVFRQARGMILNSPKLTELCKIFASYKSIEFPYNRVYKALSADAATKHGFNSHFVINDELHTQPNRDLIDVLGTSTGARDQPLTWHITTADFVRESICNEKLDYACKVRDGVLADKSFLPAIWEASIDEDFRSPEVWGRVNPNLGVSVSEDYLARECQRAIDIPAYENTFKRLHLNMKTESETRWFSSEKWNGCKAPITLDMLLGRQCYAGLDLSTTTDLSAFVMLFPDVDGRHVVWPVCWIPQDSAYEREKRDRVPYRTWIRQGHMRVTEGNSIDYDVIRREIGEFGRQFNVRHIGVDRWNAAHIIRQLTEDGFQVQAFGQGFKDMSPAAKELERLVVSKELAHPGHPVLDWCVANTMVETDAAGNIKPSKAKSTERIDLTVALVMAAGMYATFGQTLDEPQLLVM